MASGGNQGNGLPMYTNAINPNVRGMFYEGQGAQPGFIAPTQFTWSAQLPPPALQQPQQSSPPQPHTPSHTMTVFPSHAAFPGAAPPQPMHRPAIPPAYHHQQHPQHHLQQHQQPQQHQPPPQQQQQPQQHHLQQPQHPQHFQQQQQLNQQQQQQLQQQQLLHMQRMQQMQPQAVVAGSQMPQPDPPQPQPAGGKRKENKPTATAQRPKQAMREGQGGGPFEWLNGGGEGNGLQRSQSMGSQGSASSASVKSGSKKRAGSGGEEGGSKRSKQQQQGGGVPDMNGVVNGVPGQGMSHAKQPGERKRAPPKKKPPAKPAKATSPNGVASPRAPAHRPHGVSPHRGGVPSGVSLEGVPPPFLPYAPLPPSLNPQDLKNPGVLRVLKSFQRDPAACLASQKDGLLMDLARASDLAKGQRQFLEHQLSLLDSWKEQAFPAGGPAPRLPTPKHQASASESGGGSLATGGEEEEEDDMLFEGTLFDFLDDDDDAIFGGGGGDDLLQLESDVNGLSDDGRPVGPSRPPPASRPMAPPPAPAHPLDSSLSVTSHASSSSSLSNLVPCSPSSALKHEMAPPLPPSLPCPNGSVIVQIKVRVRCDSLGPMKKKERTLWANIRVPQSEAAHFQAPVVCSAKSGSKKKHSTPRPQGLGASGDLTLSTASTATSSVPGSKPPKSQTQRKPKRKGSVGSDAAPESVGPSAPSLVVELPESPFYDPLDTYADFDESTQQLWEYVEEGGWLRPLLQALGNVASTAAAEKALDELLPFEEGPKGRGPTSACLSDDFDALLDEANTRASLENVSAWDSRVDRCPSLSSLFPECPAPPRRLDHSKLACRLLSALVHVPSTRLPSSIHSSLTRPPPSDDNKADDEKEDSPVSSPSRPAPPPESQLLPPSAAAPPQSPPPSPSPSLPHSPSSPQKPPPSPQDPPPPVSPLPCSKQRLDGKGLRAAVNTTSPSAPAPPSHDPPKPPRPMAPLEDEMEPPPSRLVREGWDDRILEEMDKIGLWDAGDKHRLKEALSCGEDEDEEGEGSPRWALGRVEREELEVGVWVREAERRLQQLSHDNNVRIARLRASVMHAVKKEVEEERAQWAADQAIVDKWEKLQAARKKEEERQKAIEDAAKEAQRQEEQQQQAEKDRQAAAQAQMLATIASIVAQPPAPQPLHPLGGGLPQGPPDRYLAYGPMVSKPAPPAFAPQPHLFVAAPPPPQHVPPPQALNPMLPLPMANGLMEVDPLLLEGPAGEGYAALYDTIAALEDPPLPQTPGQQLPYYTMFPTFGEGQPMGQQDHGSFFVAADHPST